MTSGVLENPNNSLQSRFKNQSQRQERHREKQLNLESITGRETMKLCAQAKDEKLEITKLRKQIERQPQSIAGPPKPTRRQHKKAFSPLISASHTRYLPATPINISNSEEDMNDFAPCSPPARIRGLELFPGLHPVTPPAHPRSDFDYLAALNSDILDTTLKGIVEDHPMYPGDSDDEVLASDPY
ncbi:hypothetical protein B0H14DRAFT_2564371 [Mycena olivaceomarginata]|nr:hypothetical protein B0H14DRAFT_2564371 [Mycena olivaceomarginata]